MLGALYKYDPSLSNEFEVLKRNSDISYFIFMNV